ncbi:hypothetical protein ACQUSR_23580 [Streptomyces sp. P1-3]|uniref:hypothetical protein n=1 Tax=Streptomyces sp. P1-3 TaxID=3421658 RepID=UPI003D36124A
MAKLTFDDLYQVSLSSLGSAADDWKEMVGQLKDLLDDAAGMARKSDAARWAGVNADVTKPFVRKTAGEFQDAHTEATSIWSVLRDAHTDLAAIQTNLKKLVDVEAKSKGMRVQGREDGTVACVFVADRSDGDGPSQQELDAQRNLENRINGLIAQAEEIDGSVVRALRKSHGGDVHDFGHAKYDSLDDAQAERAVELAKKSIDRSQHDSELSTTELAEFRQLLAGNAKSPEFAADFYRALGPKDALTFEAQIAIDASTRGDKERLRLARSIQENMGVALGAATQPHKDNRDTAFREDKDYLGRAWVDDLKRVGRQQLALNIGMDHAQPTGHQVLSSLLHYGDYGKNFLVPIGEDMVAFERKGGSWPIPDPYNGSDDVSLNLDGKGEPGWDPMTGFMEALGRDPEASTAFFGGSTGGGESGLRKLSNLDFSSVTRRGRTLANGSRTRRAAASCRTRRAESRVRRPWGTRWSRRRRDGRTTATCLPR